MEDDDICINIDDSGDAVVPQMRPNKAANRGKDRKARISLKRDSANRESRPFKERAQTDGRKGNGNQRPAQTPRGGDKPNERKSDHAAKRFQKGDDNPVRGAKPKVQKPPPSKGAAKPTTPTVKSTTIVTSETVTSSPVTTTASTKISQASAQLSAPKKPDEEGEPAVTNETVVKDGVVCFEGSDAMDQTPATELPTPTIDDPNQFHARPRDLSENALSAPKEVQKSDHIFSRTKFPDLQIDPKLQETLTRSPADGGFGLSTSTRIQSVAVPLLIERNNVLMKSQTGSGKTLTYLLPVIHDLMTAKPSIQRSDGTRALIIAPTRELCLQISDVIEKLTKVCVSIVGGCISGGEKKKSEKARLRKGVVVLVSTPGRLLDHLKTTESFNLNSMRWVVLDEADRLLDMGFEQTILEIFSILRGEALPGLKDKNKTMLNQAAAGANLQRQWTVQKASNAKRIQGVTQLVHIMASATLTRAVRMLALPIMTASYSITKPTSEFYIVDADRELVKHIACHDDLFDPVLDAKGSSRVVEFNDDSFEDAGARDQNDSGSRQARTDGTALDKGELLEAPAQLAQYYMMVTCKWRLPALLSFLRTHSHQKVVVFFATCDSVDFHALLCREGNWPEELDNLDDKYQYIGKSPIYSQHDNNTPQKGRQNSRAAATDSEAIDEHVKNLTKQQQYSGSQRQYLEPLGAKSKSFLPNCPIYRLHGNVPQRVRQEVYREFCAAEKGVLFCTDVAARGLDLPAVHWILQYDPPCDTTDYVHRAGRTARRGLGGSALMFLLPSEAM
jgi:superfamily II DNA/RNA helicase